MFDDNSSKRFDIVEVRAFGAYFDNGSIIEIEMIDNL